MDKVQYVEKMENLLQDTKTYTGGCTLGLEGRMNAMLVQLKKVGAISSELYI